MKPFYRLIYPILFLLFILPLSNASESRSAVKCIVIDAGHGGRDPGSINGKVFEKNITLPVALKLGRLLEQKYPHIKIAYTRKDDTFVALQTRSDIANKVNGDLFISIHVNAATNRAASGTETYLMGSDRKGENMEVAMRENNVIVYEEDYTTRYEGYEPGSSESYIIFSLMSYAFQTQSLNLAAYIQREFGSNLPLKNRGVKQAGYLVLRNTAMPSILTEIGFISNHAECKYLTQPVNQDKIAQQLMKAVDNYIQLAKEVNIKTEERNIEVQNSLDENEQPAENKDATVYRILALTAKKSIVINSQQFGPFVSVVEEIKEGEFYVYYIEKMVSYKETLLLYNKVKDFIPRARIVAFKNGLAISPLEASKTHP